ncbi:MAG: thiol oxidoreductase, partial [Mesorhizobium sp.]
MRRRLDFLRRSRWAEGSPSSPSRESSLAWLVRGLSLISVMATASALAGDPLPADLAATRSDLTPKDL